MSKFGASGGVGSCSRVLKGLCKRCLRVFEGVVRKVSGARGCCAKRASGARVVRVWWRDRSGSRECVWATKTGRGCAKPCEAVVRVWCEVVRHFGFVRRSGARVWCGVPVAGVLLPASFSGIICVLNTISVFLVYFYIYCFRNCVSCN